MLKRLKEWIYNRIKPKELSADEMFQKLGFTLGEEYEHKAIYERKEDFVSYTHYIEIRINLANDIHIISYDQDMMAVQMHLDELDAALVKVHELIIRRKYLNAKYDTGAR